MAANQVQVELLSKQYSVSPEIVEQLFQQHNSLEEVRKALQTERYLYDDGHYHRNGVHGGYAEQMHHMPMSSGLLQTSPGYPASSGVQVHPTGILRTTSAYPVAHYDAQAELLERQRSVPETSVAASYARMSGVSVKPAVNAPPMVATHDWPASQGLGSTRQALPDGRRAANTSQQLHALSASTHGGQSNDVEPSRGSDDDAYTQALMKHQEARLERIKKEVNDARRALHDIERENIVKRQSHNLLCQNKGRFPTEADIQELGVENESLRFHVQKLRDDQRLTENEHWECSYCTFHNHPTMTTCEVCEMPRRRTTKN